MNENHTKLIEVEYFGVKISIPKNFMEDIVLIREKSRRLAEFWGKNSGYIVFPILHEGIDGFYEAYNYVSDEVGVPEYRFRARLCSMRESSREGETHVIDYVSMILRKRRVKIPENILSLIREKVYEYTRRVCRDYKLGCENFTEEDVDVTFVSPVLVYKIQTDEMFLGALFTGDVRIHGKTIPIMDYLREKAYEKEDEEGLEISGSPIFQPYKLYVIYRGDTKLSLKDHILNGDV